MDELVKQIPTVVWTSTGLWVILHRKHGLIFKTNPRYRFVVEVLVGDGDVIHAFQRIPTDHKAVILGGDFTFPRDQVLDRMVDATVTLEHLFGGQPLTQCNNLMPQTNSKNGFTPN